MILEVSFLRRKEKRQDRTEKEWLVEQDSEEVNLRIKLTLLILH